MLEWILRNRSHCYVLFLLAIFFACETKEKEPVEPTIEFTEISMPTIVNDVVAGGLFYEKKHIKIRAEIKELHPTGAIELQTHRPNAFFTIVEENPEPEMVGKYKKGEAYTLKLYVNTIKYLSFVLEEKNNWYIFAYILE